jgi:hypothetical protein
MKYIVNMDNDLHNILIPAVVPATPPGVAPTILDAALVVLRANTNTRESSHFKLSEQHINKLQGYCGLADAEDGYPKVSLFYQRLETTPKKDEEIHLFIENCLKPADFTHPVIGFPDVRIRIV